MSMNKGKFNLRKNLHFKDLILLERHQMSKQCKQVVSMTSLQPYRCLDVVEKQSFKLAVNGLYIMLCTW